MRERLLAHPAVREWGRRLPAPARAALKRALAAAEAPRWGNLRRLRPFSDRYGFDRGLPVDRFYIEGFLARHSGDVRGRVLEVKDAAYTRRFGGDAVTASEVLDIDPANVEATLVADLCEPDSLPAGAFDCFLLTQTLQLLPDVERGLGNAWRGLSPGGVLLLTVPTVARVDRHLSEIDFWRFTPRGLREALDRSCPGAEAVVEGFGNLVAAIAFLAGLAARELRAEELAHADPYFPVLAAARVRKPA
ncbi:MAG TPA: methyltransferase domain-containing protein [Gaiellaceae bacterium]|nr:methyltransferase domain-containing protein [Gaiellaceae bacterium]